jgi:hypothetical protein
MNALKPWLDELESDLSLEAPARLRERIQALDRLELQLINGQGGGAAADVELHRRAAAIRTKLESINDKLYETIRHAVRQGAGADLLLGWAQNALEDMRADEGRHGDRYDYLDDLVSGVLRFDRPDDAVAELPLEMVFYQPTPAHHVFDLIRRTALGEQDVLIDLGSGLGHVPLLVSICTAARAIGIEREAVYVDAARRSARALNLERVAFIQQDARAADFSRGTVFYLYTPFTGTVLRSVLDALQREAAQREIRICTYGPCTRTVLEEPWLAVEGISDGDRVVLFRSRGG